MYKKQCRNEEKVSEIKADNENLTYCGRIDFSDKENPLFIYAGSSVRFIFEGTGLCVKLINHHLYWDNYVGALIDGKQEKYKLSNETGIQRIILADGLEDKEHEVTFFKRMDSCHYLTVCGFEVDNKKSDSVDLITKWDYNTERKMEFFGDSVTAGEVAEAAGYEGKEDPKHNGEYSNSWYSYASITARKLNARVHLTAQGGIALLDNTGYFCAPNRVGMMSVYDKLRYNPEWGKVTEWDFSRYIPQVVVIAIGQNDSYPTDYMKADYNCKQSKNWRKNYKIFVKKIRNIYKNSLIILATTILNHDSNWDNAIDEVCNELRLDDNKIVHFMYHNNGCGTRGHIRVSEANWMAKELGEFIESFGEAIWNVE